MELFFKNTLHFLKSIKYFVDVFEKLWYNETCPIEEAVRLGGIGMLSFSVNDRIEDIVKPNTFLERIPTDQLAREYYSEAIMNTLREYKRVRHMIMWEGYETPDTILARVPMARVNLAGFSVACERNQRMALSARQVALLTMDEVEEGLKGVVDSVASYIDMNIDDIIERSEVKTLVADFLATYERLAIEEGVNLWTVLSKARRFDQVMIEKLRYLVEKYSLSDLIESVLRNARCISVLEGVLN